MLEFFDVLGNTDEWDALRAPLITSSNLSKVMANFGKAFGEPAKKYAVDVAVAQLSGKVSSEGYSNDHMSRGHEQEPIARAMYEDATFCDVLNGGLFRNGDLGCSPDGLVGENGVIEIKSAIPSIHYARIKAQSYDSAYRWQMVQNVSLTEREWIDFVSYCEGFPEGKQLFIKRYYREDYAKEIQQIQTRVSEFRELIEETKLTIINSEYWS